MANFDAYFDTTSFGRKYLKQIPEPILEDSIMNPLLSCEFNVDTGCIEPQYSDGSMISINYIPKDKNRNSTKP